MSKAQVISKARVLYDFLAENTDELSLQADDIVNVVQKYDNGWWVGFLNPNQIGLFPAELVKEESNPADVEPPVETIKEPNHRIRQIFRDYKKQTDGQLTVNRGESVAVISVSDGWAKVQLGGIQNEIGLIPAVCLIEDKSKQLFGHSYSITPDKRFSVQSPKDSTSPRKEHTVSSSTRVLPTQQNSPTIEKLIKDRSMTNNSNNNHSPSKGLADMSNIPNKAGESQDMINLLVISLKDTLKVQNEDIVQMQKENKRLRGVNENLTAELETLKQELQFLQSQTNFHRNQIDDLRAEVTRLQEENSTLKRDDNIIPTKLSRATTTVGNTTPRGQNQNHFQIPNQLSEKKITGLPQAASAPVISATPTLSRTTVTGYSELQDMTFEQKTELATKITKLSSGHLEEIVKIITKSMPQMAENEEIELDISSLDIITLRHLDKFCNNALKQQQT